MSERAALAALRHIPPTERGARDIAREAALIAGRRAVRLTIGTGPPYFYAAEVMFRSHYDSWNPLYRGCIAHALRQRLGVPPGRSDLTDIEFVQIIAADLKEAGAAYERAIKGRPNVNRPRAWPKDVKVAVRR